MGCPLWGLGRKEGGAGQGAEGDRPGHRAGCKGWIILPKSPWAQRLPHRLFLVPFPGLPGLTGGQPPLQPGDEGSQGWESPAERPHALGVRTPAVLTLLW